MIFKRLFGAKRPDVGALYGAIVAAARQPHFYRDWQVPDTVDGRFDMVVLHLYLVVARLKGEPEVMRQALINHFCVDMDDNLRELGAGDLSVAKKVRRMAEAFQGRCVAYDSAMDVVALAQALHRNVFAGGEGQAESLATYVLEARRRLAAQGVATIIAGTVAFA